MPKSYETWKGWDLDKLLSLNNLPPMAKVLQRNKELRQQSGLDYNHIRNQVFKEAYEQMERDSEVDSEDDKTYPTTEGRKSVGKKKVKKKVEVNITKSRKRYAFPDATIKRGTANKFGDPPTDDESIESGYQSSDASSSNNGSTSSDEFDPSKVGRY